MKEHTRTPRLKHVNKSSVAEQSLIFSYMIGFNITKIHTVDIINCYKIIIKKAVEICNNPSNFNNNNKTYVCSNKRKHEQHSLLKMHTEQFIMDVTLCIVSFVSLALVFNQNMISL